MPCDCSLILAAKSGDAVARDKTIAALLPLVRRQVRQQLHMNGLTQKAFGEDAMQSALLALLEALAEYDPETGGDFSTFSMRKVHAAVKAMVRAECDHRGNTVGPVGDDFEDKTSPRIRFQDLGIDTLPDRARRIFMSYHGIGCRAQDAGEIAEELGLTRRRVKQILAECLEQMRPFALKQEE